MSKKYHSNPPPQKTNWEMIVALGAIMLTSLGVSVTLYVHSDSVANERHKETTAHIQAIHEEMKDFHGRLCAIEERNKGVK